MREKIIDNFFAYVIAYFMLADIGVLSQHAIF